MAEQPHLASARDDARRGDPVAPGAVPLEPAGADPPRTRPIGFEHLGWQPSWRDRLEGVIGAASPGRLAVAAAAVAVAIVVVAALVLRGPAPPPPELTLPVAGGTGDPAASTTTTAATGAVGVDVVVHAAGAVVRPGVYHLAAGSRVADLLEVSGGPAPGADLDRLNLATALVDGDRIFVPLPDQAVPTVDSSGGATAAPGTPEAPVDLNGATLDELDVLPGVGPATAQAILDERERRGGFTSVEELLEVRGIGDAKLAALRDLVRV